MSKKKKIKIDSNYVSKTNLNNLKNVHKIKKKKLNKLISGESTKLNKQVVKDKNLSKAKSKLNMKNIKTSKVKDIQNVKDTRKSTIKNNQNNKVFDQLKIKNEQVTKCNTKNLECKNDIKNRNLKQLNSNSSFKRLNVNRLNDMLKAKESENCLSNKKKNKKQDINLSLRDRMLNQLKASRFRFLNEQMYNSTSSQSKKYFQEDPQAFHAYHEGYKTQIEQWPINPLDIIIESIQKMPKDYIIADFGCGEAKLADSVSQTVHSFDLVAMNDKVKACDMAQTPLLTGRVNVVVFCLSLMGSNLGDYLLEANRVLTESGIIKIAEVESRFNKIDDFIKLMSYYGFVNTWTDLSNNLFYFLDFKKNKNVLKKDIKKLPLISLKPCLYKKR